ncbi:MAG: exopolyphosphatase [Alphaproteobacteria bacterium]|jgi:nanoRNase/pAp phosphatase (c-di-AMP/oligoRNAs hydrolase)|nr:exopolyphosphatase [Alphaproteobacteria bacterium]MCB1551671.1 exopolyphosphatase [Alphaproteobacteria bacterium]MCB9984826.1 exopolyphosphatase [Micavibrio sp.]HRK97218.1 exopolyphosphatase [Alphaproteobacteria bacterium]
MSQSAKLMPLPNKSYRLITRSDMDGLVCGILLKELGMIDDITFAHPKDMQDGLIEVGQDDITTNLPYVEGVFMAFDHHASEVERVGGLKENHIIDPKAPSAARVVYDYFGGKSRFPRVPDEMMEAVDKADSAAFTKEDVLNPQGWELLSFLMDARTGLGRFRDFSISNYQLMMQLIDFCREHDDIKEILELPDVKERVELFKEQQSKFREQIERCARIKKNVIALDLRNEDTIYAGNRFMIYALFPQCNISIHILWGKNKQNTVFAIGKSILNKTSTTDIGALCLSYAGGGHNAAGTCQVDNLKADEILDEIVEKLNKDG